MSTSKKKTPSAPATKPGAATPARSGTSSGIARKTKARAAPPKAANQGASSDAATSASTALAFVQNAEDALTFFDPSAKDLKAARVANRVPVAALVTAAAILEKDPSRYPDFDAATVRDAADYVSAMESVVEVLATFQQRLARSVFNRHGQGAAETLALYQTLKGLARVTKGKDVLSQLKLLAKQMAPTRKKENSGSTKAKSTTAGASSAATSAATPAAASTTSTTSH